MISTRNSAILMIFNAVLSANLFGFVARTETPWTDDQAPPTNTDIEPSDFNTEIAFLKRMDFNSIRFMIVRTDWVAGDYLVDDFVITDRYRIYRRVTAGASSSSPVHMSGTTDGWEFIDELSTADQAEYLSETLMPLTIKDERYLFVEGLIKRIRLVFSIVGFEGGNLPGTRRYRVAGVMANPLPRAERTNTHGTDISQYGYPIVWNTLAPFSRVAEQIDTHVFDIILPE